jgi:ABC-2 type transport system permease protein
MNRDVFVLTLRQLLGRRRTLLMVAFALLPVLAAAIYRANGSSLDPPRWTAIVLLNGLVVTTLLPLVALVFGTSALGGEIEDGTAVYLLAKPIPRREIMLAKLAAAWLCVALIVTFSALVSGLVAINGSPEQGIVTGFVIAIVLGSFAYTCVFLLLSVLTSRALIAGLIYVFFWEGIVTGIFSGTRVFSIRQYTLGVADLIADTSKRTFQARLDGTEGLILMAVVSVAALVLAVERLRRFEMRESG